MDKFIEWTNTNKFEAHIYKNQFNEDVVEFSKYEIVYDKEYNCYVVADVSTINFLFLNTYEDMITWAEKVIEREDI